MLDDILTPEQIDKHATRSLVHGIVAFLFPIVIFSILALKHAKRVPLGDPQRGIATAGKALGIVGYVLSAIWLISVLLIIVVSVLVAATA